MGAKASVLQQGLPERQNSTRSQQVCRSRLDVLMFTGVLFLSFHIFEIQARKQQLFRTTITNRVAPTVEA